MKSYSIYNSNGQILKCITVPDNLLEFQVEEGCSAILGAYDDTVYYVATTGLHKATLMPPKPSESHVFNYETKTWVDSRTLRVIKNTKWESIKRIRNSIEFGTFQYSGMIFDGDLDAQRRLATYISISKSNPDFSAMFILANNEVVNLTANDFIAIEVAKAMQVANAFERAATLRNLIENSNTEAEIDSISW